MLRIQSKKLAATRGPHWEVDREEADVVFGIGRWAFEAMPGGKLTLPWQLKAVLGVLGILGFVVAPRLMEDQIRLAAFKQQMAWQAQHPTAPVAHPDIDPFGTPPSQNGVSPDPLVKVGYD